MLKTTTVDPKDITCVFSCEDCEKEEKESVSTIAYDGAPVCTNCDVIMELDHVIVEVS